MNIKYLTVPQIADSLKTDQAKVLAWIHSGELRAINIATVVSKRPRWRVREADLESFFAARTPAPKPSPTIRRRKRTDAAVIEFY